VGTSVIVTGYELGAAHWGGWSELIRVPSSWVVPLPQGLTLRESMILGTAGFTAAQCTAELMAHDVTPDGGEVVVSGATGGVGCLAVCVLAKLGYRVVAATGKPAAEAWLRQLGAARIIPRQHLEQDADRPLLPAVWSGAVDTVGGATLGTLVRSTKVNGCVAACGLVGGTELPLNVYPFILRGVTLAGITSAWCPRARRLQMWRNLAGPWKPGDLESLVTSVHLRDVDPYVDSILNGQIRGRVIVEVAGDGV
jgi:putative YhdH/YhfP family quinone oxidoreductase